MSNVPISFSTGFAGEVEDATLIAHAALSAGDVVAVSMTTIDSSTLQWTTTVAPASLATSATDTATYPFFAVALNAVASGAKGRFRLRGPVDALCGDTTAAGGHVTVNSSKQLVAPAPTGTNTIRCVGILLQTGVSGALKRCWFNGIEGVSHAISIA